MAGFKSCPREGASAQLLHGLYHLRFQFQVMPPRGGINDYLVFAISAKVSSHAPARGHRCMTAGAKSACVSFKSCPREGASRQVAECYKSLGKFQVMPPRGGIIADWFDAQKEAVSSHAPARGHRESPEKFKWYRGFKSCPREGASSPTCLNLQMDQCFKSCPREGASSQELPTQTAMMFQVMPPRGGIEWHIKENVLSVLVSSHAPARGHRGTIRTATEEAVFQVMPPRGGICKSIQKQMAHYCINRRYFSNYLQESR